MADGGTCADEIIGSIGKEHIAGKVVVDLDPESPRVLAQGFLDHGGARHVITLDDSDVFKERKLVRVTLLRGPSVRANV